MITKFDALNLNFLRNRPFWTFYIFVNFKRGTNMCFKISYLSDVVASHKIAQRFY